MRIGGLLLLTGCGWHVGPPPQRFTPAPVTGANIEPGLRAVIDTAVVQALRERGVAGGRIVDIELASSAVEATAAHAGSDGQVAYRAGVELLATDEGECRVSVQAQRVFVLPSGAPLAGAQSRSEALRAASEDAARRLVDGLLGEERCH